MSDYQAHLGNSILGKELTRFTNDYKTQELAPYMFLLVAVIVIAIALGYASGGSDVLKRSTLANIYLIMIPVAGLLGYMMMYLYKTDDTKKNGLIIMLVSIIVIYGISTIYESIQLLNSSYKYYLNGVFFAVSICIILFGLAAIYNMMRERIRRMTGTIGFILNFLFFIPCVIDDFFAYIKDQFKLTPSVVYIYLCIEVVLLLAFIYLPRSIQSDLITNGKMIMKDPKFLDSKFIVANSKELPMVIKKGIPGPNDSNKMHYNYTISMWIYLNPQATSQVPKRIFSYGPDDNFNGTPDLAGSYKPLIEHISSRQESDITKETAFDDFKDKYRITFSNCQEPEHSDALYMDCSGNTGHRLFIDAPSQKWNNFVFNYDNNAVDVFLNGELVRSVDLNGNIPIYDGRDKVIIGNDKNMEGSICNITFFDKVLSKTQIATYYNLMFNKNPPVNNIL
jgi:hypothetical protein